MVCKTSECFQALILGRGNSSRATCRHIPCFHDVGSTAGDQSPSFFRLKSEELT
jgi:hypothetical protein